MTMLRQPAPIRIGAPPQRYPAPVWIRAFAAVVAIAAAAVAIVLAAAAGDTRDGLADIGHRTAPQVAATEDLYFVLSDMDAQLVNVLLAGDDPAMANLREFALGTYEKDRTSASTYLQQATMAAADDADGRRKVRQLLDEFGRYQSLAAQTIMLNDREGNDAGRPSADVLSLQRQATDGMHATLEAARGLTNVNVARVGESYEDIQGTNVAARWLLLAVGLVLIGSLVGLQVVLRMRMRRRLNPAAVAATLLAGWLAIGGFALLVRESAHLRGAKEDAFDSLAALRQVRAVSYDANADESRFLLDPERADRYEHDFLVKSQSLAGVGNVDLSAYAEGLDVAMSTHSQPYDLRITGFFAKVLTNVTFAGEQYAADRTMAAYQKYQQDDRKIRQLAAEGDARKAIEFCVGGATGTSNYHFYRYDKDLTALIDINQRAFDSSIAAGEAEVGGWTGLLPYGAAVLIVVLVAVGVWPRLAEYR